MRTTITLDDDVAEAAKALARTTGQTLGQVISELVRRSMSASRVSTRKGRLPAFDVGDSTEVIPTDRARKLMDKEGW